MIFNKMSMVAAARKTVAGVAIAALALTTQLTLTGIASAAEHTTAQVSSVSVGTDAADPNATPDSNGWQH